MSAGGATSGGADEDPRRLEVRAAIAAALAPWPLLLGMTILALPIGVLTFVAAGMAAVKALRGRPGAARNWFGGVIFGTVALTLQAVPPADGAAQLLVAIGLIFVWPMAWSVVGVVATARAESARRRAWGRDYEARRQALASRARPQPLEPLGPVSPADDDLAYLDAIADDDSEGGRAAT